MFLYVAEFDKRKGLKKIGITKEPKARFNTLKVYHGDVLEFTLYEGENYKVAEKYLHALFKNNCVRVQGDGGTEFFKDLDSALIKKRVKELGLVEHIDFRNKLVNFRNKLVIYSDQQIDHHSNLKKSGYGGKGEVHVFDKQIELISKINTSFENIELSFLSGSVVLDLSEVFNTADVVDLSVYLGNKFYLSYSQSGWSTLGLTSFNFNEKDMTFKINLADFKQLMLDAFNEDLDYSYNFFRSLDVWKSIFLKVLDKV